MAEVENSGKTTAPAASPPAKLLCTELVLRLLLFAVSLSALVVLVTAKQTVMVPVVLTPPFRFAPVPAQFKDSPALIYLLVALCITCLYSLLTAASSVIKSRGSATRIFVLILLDVVYAGIMASATGAAGAVAWVGLKGNEHTRWNKICHIYDKFCRHIGTSTALGLVASVLLVLLAVLNAHALYRRSR